MGWMVPPMIIHQGHLLDYLMEAGAKLASAAPRAHLRV